MPSEAIPISVAPRLIINLESRRLAGSEATNGSASSRLSSYKNGGAKPPPARAKPEFVVPKCGKRSEELPTLRENGKK